METSVAGLPARPTAEMPPNALANRPPEPNPVPRVFTHTGDADEAYAIIGWNTFGGTDRIKDRRALSMAANMFAMRLYERLDRKSGVSGRSGAVRLDLGGWRPNKKKHIR